MEKGLYKFESLVTRRIRLQVPLYQRNYAWDEKQWEDFWNDLYYLDADKTHFFGTIILMERGRHEEMQGLHFEKLEIVDGQQRIATALILLSEIIAQIEQIRGLPEENIRKLKEDYLRFKSVYKLELLGDDREFFRRYVIDGEEYLDKPLTLSQERLIKAKNFFKKRLEEVKPSYPQKFRDFLIQHKQKMETMEIMVYPIKETAEAARMFELVNDRGKILTNLEKTKSYLMYMIYLAAPAEEQERYLRDLNDRFGNIFRWIVEIQASRFGHDIGEDNIQRYHFTTFATKHMLSLYLSRAEASYRYMQILKDHIMQRYRTDKKKCLEIVLDYTKDLEKAFSVLKNVLTYDRDNEIKSFLERIFLLGRAANFYPLLIACWPRFQEEIERLKEILRLVEVIAFRVYAIGRRRADTGRGRLYDLAYEVREALRDYDGLISELKYLISRYEWNRQFETHLKTDDFYVRVAGRDIRYLLYQYESHLRKLKDEPLEFTLTEILSRDDWGRPKYEIEHIWPQDPSLLGLSKEELEEHEQCVNRLGNLTLAAKGWNIRMGKKPFDKKCKKYGKSILRVQIELTSHKEWGKKQIDQREKELTQFTLGEWRV